MFRIIEGRGTGKTSRLMLIAKENSAIFVCSNPYAMRAKAENYGIIGLQFMSYEDFLDSRGRGIKNYVIDEVETFLQYAVKKANGVPISGLIGYTLSKED